jgi:hypothetical protein
MPADGREREPDVEAGDYIEDDPVAWAAWIETVRRYVPGYYRELVEHIGTDEGAASIVGGAMLSYLADQHGLFLSREAAAVPALLTERDRLIDALSTLADQIEALPLYVGRPRTMADAAESVRIRAVQLVRGSATPAGESE